MGDPLSEIDKIVNDRKGEADEFYESIHPRRATEEEKLIQRRALSGMLWGKQVYLFDVQRWLEGDSIPAPESHKKIRNEEHTSELQSLRHLVCRLLLEKKK